MVEFIVKGGVFMYPIMLCSIVSLAIFLDKLWHLREKKNIPQPFLKEVAQLLADNKINEALELCRRNPSTIARILSAGINQHGKKREIIKERIEEVGRREASLLDRYIEALSTVAGVSTLLGLLGTISGMIKIFSVIASERVVNPSNLAGGISEALYTTAAGLSVAIPTIVFYRYVSGRSHALVMQMEEYAAHMIEMVKARE